MSIHDDARDTESKLEKAGTRLAKAGKESLSDIQDIKENVVGLARNIRETSTDKAHVAVDYVRDRIEDLKDQGTDAVLKVEKRIKAKPGQSVAIAFTAGLLASYLLGRRSS